MKFVKAKELVAITSAVEKVKVEKKPKVIALRVLTKPPNPAVAIHKTKGKSLPKLQRGPKTIVESKVTLDLIASSFGH